MTLLSKAQSLVVEVKKKIASKAIYTHLDGTGGTLFTLVLMLVALSLRFAIAPLDAGIQYITFFPAVAIAAVRGGIRQGMLSVLLGMGFATYFFTAPYHSFSTQALISSFGSNLVFFADGLIVCYSIGAMHQFRNNYAQELLESQKSEAHIKTVNKELDDFAYIASHDLKEPLRGINNYASFLEEDYAEQLDDEGKQYISSIIRLTQRMTSLIDQLLVYSRLGATDIKKKSINLDELLEEVSDNISTRLADEAVTLNKATPLGWAEGDSTRIMELFQNLISNGLKYNDKTTKSIEIGCDTTQGNPTYYVKDNGIGIPHKHIDSVFRIFKRLHEQSKYGGGSGAGLTIVKKIIERHGGKIWLESEAGEGTTFFFTLSEDQSHD